MSSDPHYERLRAAYEAGEPALTIELGKLYLTAAVGLDPVYEAALDALHDVEQVLFHFPEA